MTGLKVLRFDVWGGECSCDHLARYHYAIDDHAWINRQRQELDAGYLVNVRTLGQGEGWGGSEDFDARTPLAIGRG